MIKVNINDDELQAKLKQVENFPVGDMLRAIAVTMLPVVKDRIHEQGLDANGSQIGTYTPAYLKKRIKAGKGASPKVIISFERQLQGDFAVIADETKGYGLGFHNDINFQKSQGLEQRAYKKKIWALTEGEKDLALAAAKEFFSNAFPE